MANLMNTLQENGTGYITGYCRSTNNRIGLLKAVEDVWFPEGQEGGNEAEGVTRLIPLIFSNNNMGLGTYEVILEALNQANEMTESVEGRILVGPERNKYIHVTIDFKGNHPIGQFQAILYK